VPSLHIVNGLSTDNVAILTGQYLYVINIHNDITWAGTSPISMSFSGGSPAPFAGSKIVAWDSPFPTTRLPNLDWLYPAIPPAGDYPNNPFPTWHITDQNTMGILHKDATTLVYRGAFLAAANGNVALLFDLAFGGYNASIDYAISALAPAAFIDSLATQRYVGEPGGSLW
jgi:hypothetical protein